MSEIKIKHTNIELGRFVIYLYGRISIFQFVLLNFRSNCKNVVNTSTHTRQCKQSQLSVSVSGGNSRNSAPLDTIHCKLRMNLTAKKKNYYEPITNNDILKVCDSHHTEAHCVYRMFGHMIVHQCHRHNPFYHHKCICYDREVFLMNICRK